MDLFLGRTMTEVFQFVSFGTAHTFTWDFPPDKVVFNNLNAWGNVPPPPVPVPGRIPVSVWFNPESGTGTSLGKAHQQVNTNNTSALFTFSLAASNGFTVANTVGGPQSQFAFIAGVTTANPCVVTTVMPHGFQTDQIIRITDLGNSGAVANGMLQLDGQRFGIIVISATTFSLYDPITLLPINSTLFSPWIQKGRVDVESRVISLNNPQQPPYNVNPYLPNPQNYAPIVYQLTAGTAVMGAVGDVFWVEVYKFGEITNLGTFTS